MIIINSLGSSYRGGKAKYRNLKNEMYLGGTNGSDHSKLAEGKKRVVMRKQSKVLT